MAMPDTAAKFKCTGTNDRSLCSMQTHHPESTETHAHTHTHSRVNCPQCRGASGLHAEQHVPGLEAEAQSLRHSITTAMRSWAAGHLHNPGHSFLISAAHRSGWGECVPRGNTQGSKPTWAGAPAMILASLAKALSQGLQQTNAGLSLAPAHAPPPAQ